MPLRTIARKLFGISVTCLIRVEVSLVRYLVKYSNSVFILGNNVTLKIDGVGAQIQRLISTLALSRFLGIGFVQNPFEDISVHALDPFQDDEAKKVFLLQMNTLFKLENQKEFYPDQTVEVQTLSSWRLLKLVIRNFYGSGTICINLVEPYPITDAYPNIGRSINTLFPSWMSFSSELVKDYERPLVSLHYRQGVGGSVFYPGQKISRELPASYFVEKLKLFPGKARHKSPIHIFTDAPLHDISYFPRVEQQSHWEGTPGYENGKMQIQGNDLNSFFQSQGIEVLVHRGGNPLEAIAIMSKSDFLITSRSSLSYLAGLLNSEGTVIAAKGFWHPAPKFWVTS